MNEKLNLLRDGDFTRRITDDQLQLALSYVKKRCPKSNELEYLEQMNGDTSAWSNVPYAIRCSIETIIYQQILTEENEAKLKAKSHADYCTD